MDSKASNARAERDSQLPSHGFLALEFDPEGGTINVRATGDYPSVDPSATGPILRVCVNSAPHGDALQHIEADSLDASQDLAKVRVAGSHPVVRLKISSRSAQAAMRTAAGVFGQRGVDAKVLMSSCECEHHQDPCWADSVVVTPSWVKRPR